jgi:hypothetical protein
MPDDWTMVEDIRSAEGCVNGIELNQWEEEFMESIEERLNAGRSLSEKQREKLQEIWDRI